MNERVLNMAYCTHMQSMQKEAAIPQWLLRTLSGARSATTSATGQTLMGAAGGAALAKGEEELIKHETGSDHLRPMSKAWLYGTGILRGAAIGNPAMRKGMFGRDELTDTAGNVLYSRGRPFRNLSAVGVVGMTPAMGAYAVHKIAPTKPMADTGTAAEAVNIVDKGPVKTLTDALADSFTKKMLPKELADMYNDPSLRDSNGNLDMKKALPVMRQNESALRKTELWPLYKAVLNPQDAVKDFGSAAGEQVGKTLKEEGRDVVRTYMPDIARSMGVSAGLGLAGGGLGWLAGAAGGTALFPDRPNQTFEQRLSAQRKRTAMKIVLSTIGSAGLMYMAGQHGGNAVQAVDNLIDSSKKLRAGAADTAKSVVNK